MDTNWFDSTLVQSAAALVGLLGGILITKMINSEEKTMEEKRDLQNQLEGWKSWIIRRINIDNLPAGTGESTRDVLTKVNNEVRDTDFGNFEKFQKITSFLKREALVINETEWSDLKHQLEHPYPLEVFKIYNPKRLPVKYIFATIILSYLSAVGIIVPLHSLAGYNSIFFWSFSLGIVAFFGWVFYLLFEYSRHTKLPKI